VYVLLLAGLLLAHPAHADRAVARKRVEEGRALAAAGDRAGALSRFEDALAADADYLPAYDAATELWIARGEVERVVDVLSRVTLRHPDYLNGWYALGFAYRKLGRPKLAIACYDAYLGYRSEDPDPYFGVAMAALDLGDRARAVTALRRYLALERRPSRAEYVERARAELVRMGEDVGRPADADRPGDPFAVARELLGDGRAGSAIRLLAGMEAAGEIERLRLIALSHLAAGDRTRAGRTAALALARAPHDPSLLALLADLARAAADSARAAYFDALATARR
jgi:tetratricopeptide (TPR) repeat protein